MAEQPEKLHAAAEDTEGVSGTLTAEQRSQLRERSAAARANAKAAAARCVELKAQFEASVSEQAEWRASLTRVLPELRESIARYARCLKDEGAAPEQMLVLVKEALFEVVPSAASGASALLDLSVGCAIEAYYGQTAA